MLLSLISLVARAIVTQRIQKKGEGGRRERGKRKQREKRRKSEWRLE
jgi:hypothetical protein